MNRFVSNAIKLYPHPSFVYAARHHPTSHHLIVSGGYDRVVRVWSKTTDNLHGKVYYIRIICLRLHSQDANLF